MRRLKQIKIYHYLARNSLTFLLSEDQKQTYISSARGNSTKK